MAAFPRLDRKKGKVVSDKHQAATPSDSSPRQDVMPTDGAVRSNEAEPPEGIRALALDYPLALVAGGVVAGVLIGSLLPRNGPGRLSRGAAAFAGLAGEWGLSYARKALDGVAATAHTAADAGGKVAEVVSTRASDVLETAGETVGSYSGKAADTAETAYVSLRNSAEGLARQVIRLTSHLRH